MPEHSDQVASQPSHSFSMGSFVGGAALAAVLALGGVGVGMMLGQAPANAQDTVDLSGNVDMSGGEIEPLPVSPPQGAPMSFASLVERVSPAVVSVRVEVAAPEFAGGNVPFPFGDRFPFGNGQPRGPQGPSFGTQSGSGFVINDDGYIVTNHHVVEGGVSYVVVLADGTEVDAELVGTDEATDLAVLRIDHDEPLPYVTFAEQDNLRVGDWVVAVGNPFGLGGTVTAGIVSARGRDLSGSVYNNFIQIDAPINSGNSGGPTFDLQGRVIGVNTLIFSPSGGNVGIGFAIPSEVASNVVDQIIHSGGVQRGWLGVQIQPVTEDVALSVGLDEARGAIINQVFEGTPADRAGFERGDIVLEVNGENVANNIELTRRVAAIRPGEATEFTVWRDGRERELRATLDLREDTVAAATDETPGAPGKDGAGDVEMAADILPGLTLSSARTGEGVSIVAVAPNTQAAETGLRPGSVIVTVSGEEVSTPEEVASQVSSAREAGRSAVLLLVSESGQERFVALRLESDAG